MTTTFKIFSARVTTASKRTFIAAIGASAVSLLAMSATANASAQLPAPQTRVDFADLDLAKPADTARLYRRLRAASENVCRDFTNYAGARAREQHRDCLSNALTDAVATIGHPALTTLHVAKTDMKLAQRKSDEASKS